MRCYELSKKLRADQQKMTTQSGATEDDHHNKKCKETSGNTDMGAQVLVENGRGTMTVDVVDCVIVMIFMSFMSCFP